jgi:hypothetical protein
MFHIITAKGATQRMSPFYGNAIIDLSVMNDITKASPVSSKRQ